MFSLISEPVYKLPVCRCRNTGREVPDSCTGWYRPGRQMRRFGTCRGWGASTARSRPKRHLRRCRKQGCLRTKCLFKPTLTPLQSKFRECLGLQENFEAVSARPGKFLNSSRSWEIFGPSRPAKTTLKEILDRANKYWSERFTSNSFLGIGPAWRNFRAESGRPKI